MGKASHCSVLALEDSMDCIDHGVAKRRTRLSDLTLFSQTVSIFHCHQLWMGAVPKWKAI